MSAYNTQLLTCAKLITDAARAGFLKKAVLSKHTSPDTVKTTLTVRQIGGKNCLQGERLYGKFAGWTGGIRRGRTGKAFRM